jgi:hypothetical protein
MGIKKEAVSRLINSLVKKEYIISEVKSGKRNFSRKITLNKLLFDPKQNVIPPLTNCLETIDNKTSNKTSNKREEEKEQENTSGKTLHTDTKYRRTLTEIYNKSSIKSKVRNDDKTYQAYLALSEDLKNTLEVDYLQHQIDEGNYAKTLENYMLIYQELSDNDPMIGPYTGPMIGLGI